MVDLKPGMGRKTAMPCSRKRLMAAASVAAAARCRLCNRKRFPGFDLALGEVIGRQSGQALTDYLAGHLIRRRQSVVREKFYKRTNSRKY